MSAEQERARADRQEARSDRAEVRAVTTERRYIRGWYFYLIAVVWMVCAPAVVYGLSVANTKQSEQAWCDVITVLDDAYKAVPPQTDTGRRIAAAMAGIRDTYHC